MGLAIETLSFDDVLSLDIICLVDILWVMGVVVFW